MAETRYTDGDSNESERGPVIQTEPAPNHTESELDMATSKSTKSPAFQFYPEAWLSSSKVSRMTHTERGMYTDLLAHCWLDNGLPADVRLLAAMLKVPAQRFARIWSSGALHECFVERNGRLHNARLDRERRKQTEFRKQRQDAALTRWSHEPRNASALHPQSSLVSISNSVSTSRNTEDSAESQSDSSPTVLTFPTIGKGPKSWALTEAHVADWLVAYPGVDVRGECHRALAWVKANQAKTAKGMPAFLVRWLNTATNRGPRALPATGTEGRGRTGAPPAGKYDHIVEQG